MTHISVALAAYHGEKYIAEQLESLFHQTRIPDEILIGDDSEDDATFRAVESVKKDYSGTLYIFRNPVRFGLRVNFENLYRQASGDIVFFCDQDDVWLPEKIERMCLEMESHPECDLVFCDSRCVDDSLHSLGFTMFERYGLTPKDISRINNRKAFPLIALRDVPFSGHNIALRKPLKYDVFPFENKITLYHDQFLGCLTSYAERMRCLPLPLTLHRRHGNNVSKLFDQKKIIQKYSPRNGLVHAEKLRDFAARMHEIQNFLQSRFHGYHKVKHANAEYLADLIQFFEKRRNLLFHSPLIRLFHLSPHDFLFYFRYCKGLKTLTHDLVCKTISEGKSHDL